jgi:hypothetical protein
MPMTPAALLAATAVDMRQLAEAATDGPWRAEYSGTTGNVVIPADAESTLEFVARTQLLNAYFDAEHIAAWDPDMARAVANWLDAKATKYGAYAPWAQDEMVATGTGTLAPMLKVCAAWWKSRGREPVAP